MSKLTLCSVFVVLCVIQYVSAKYDWEEETDVQGSGNEKEIPFVILGRHERSSKSRKPDAKTLKQLRKGTRATQTPCKCSEQSCTCCAKFSVDGKSDEGCATFKIPDGKTRNQMVRYNFNFNDQNSQTQAPTGRDPKGMCQPFPRYPSSMVCSRFHSTKIENGKVRFCLTMEAKYQGFTFYQMDFDCVTYDVENQQQATEYFWLKEKLHYYKECFINLYDVNTNFRSQSIYCSTLYITQDIKNIYQNMIKVSSS